MKNFILFALLLLTLSCATVSKNTNSNNPELNRYTDFLQSQNTSGKDYIFQLFKKYDIVIICERDHAEVTQYDLILDILKDKRFTKNIKNIYCEVGNSAYNNELNNFLKNPNLTEKEISENILMMQRNIFPFIWEKATYANLLNGVYFINKNLDLHKKISLYSLDYAVKWETAKSTDIDQILALNDSRDSLMADNFKNLFLKSNSKKALIIMNSRHAFLNDFVRKNFGSYVAKNFQGKVANVFLNTISFTSTKVSDTNVPESAISSPQNGKWEASFITLGKDNIGFNFKDSPFGKDSFDMLPIENSFTYSDMFNGFIYYKPLPEWKRIIGLENLIDKNFEAEALRRFQIEANFLKNIYKNNSTSEELMKSMRDNFSKTKTQSYRDFLPEVVKKIESYVEKSPNR